MPWILVNNQSIWTLRCKCTFCRLIGVDYIAMLPCHVNTIVLASILAQCLACHGVEEVSGSHASRLKGPWLIDQQTDDPNDCSERIKCLLSSPFIPFSFPPYICTPLWGWGLYWWAQLGGGGSSLAGCGSQLGYYYWHVDQSSTWLESYIDIAHMTGLVLSVMGIFN